MSDTISVIVSKNDPQKGIFGASAAFQTNIPIEKIKSGLEDLVDGLRSATKDIAAGVGNISLKELEVGIEITAEGGISLIGTAKTGVAASIKLIFSYKS